MKKSSARVAFAILAALMGATGFGCAAATYQVKVNGYSDPATPARFEPGATFFVMDNKESKNPLLDNEIKAKINTLLERRGFSIAPFEKARYYLFFSYGLGSSQGARVAMPDYSIGFGLGYGYYSPHYDFLFWPGYAYYPGYYAEPLYDRWLLINVVEGQHYRDTGKFRTVWVGETRSTGTSSDIREVINPLLLAAFTQFGQDTGKAVTVDVRKDDPRMRQLERVR
ncbi:MAG: DUF4136 domain-containing protein [Deltaproteobacteria bacterium]|nr:DUF4136 domain-containing protein [Deltaproteobacteria bacterium]